MCGRFTLHIPPELLAEIFGLDSIPVIPARYNIAPTQQIAVVRSNAGGANHLAFLRWGFIPSWAKDPSIGNKMINARAETVHEKPAFRHAIKFRRCIVVASGFYEWKQEGNLKVPLYVYLKDGSPVCFAGLWEVWKSLKGIVLNPAPYLPPLQTGLLNPCTIGCR